MRILRGDFPSKIVRLIENSTVLVDGKPLARVVAADPDSDPKVQYVEKNLTDLQIDKEDLKKRFEDGSTRTTVSEDAWMCL